jgi:hypothetical protein
MLYIETPNTNRHVHAHKCLPCAGIEPEPSCVVGEYSDHYAKSAVRWEGDISQGLVALVETLIHTYHSRFIPEGVAEAWRYCSETPMFYQNYLAVRNTADVTGGKPIAVWSQSISDVNAVNPLVAFYDIHGRKREVLSFHFVSGTTRDFKSVLWNNSQLKLAV